MATKSELVQKIVDRASADPAFRKLLKEDAGAAIKSLGMTTRKNVRVHVLEESAEEGYLVLPFRSQPGKDGALSDDALAGATGGAALGCPVCGAG